MYQYYIYKSKLLKLSERQIIKNVTNKKRILSLMICDLPVMCTNIIVVFHYCIDILKKGSDSLLNLRFSK